MALAFEPERFVFSKDVATRTLSHSLYIAANAEGGSRASQHDRAHLRIVSKVEPNLLNVGNQFMMNAFSRSGLFNVTTATPLLSRP